ncbi:hypothetical protein GL263_03330 [Streptomyces durbertensis]|uniref:Uncharacterized protein n=1 Tax=Streptomyces durbertensis TaxID=2448886 RepID=A0ABR6EB94_9ACTN|nr:hypothetical protein [Streptomyces durbertensis]MBB1242607.1 hypothetical protein [Streptomyces durbertensis]
MNIPLQVFLYEEEAEDDQLDRMTGSLRQELLQLEVADVVPLEGAEPPPGSRAFALVPVGALLVTLAQSATSLRELINTIREWRHRNETRPSIRLVIDGDVLEVSEASADQVTETFELFIRRHSEPEAPP